MSPEPPEGAVSGFAREGAGRGEERAVTGRMRRCRIPDLTGMTVGTWMVLYETTEEENPRCMCRCVRCGVRRIIPAIKIRKRYALRCKECRIRETRIGEVREGD